jgi:Uma2 family endonuclease
MSSAVTGDTEFSSRDISMLPRMTYAEFLDWPHEDQHVEWVSGRVVPMAPISDEHMDVVGFLHALLRAFAQDRGLGIVRTEPTNMKTGPDLPGRCPDILFVARENQSRVKKVFIDGPADLVIEVTSPESRSRDRGEKFAEYEQGGVREYWLIDAERGRADFYQLAHDGTYKLIVPDEQGIYRSAVLAGLWLKVDWLWQRPLPTVLEVLREWKLV